MLRRYDPIHKVTRRHRPYAKAEQAISHADNGERIDRQHAQCQHYKQIGKRHNAALPHTAPHEQLHQKGCQHAKSHAQTGPRIQHQTGHASEHPWRSEHGQPQVHRTGQEEAVERYQRHLDRSLDRHCGLCYQQKSQSTRHKRPPKGQIDCHDLQQHITQEQSQGNAQATGPTINNVTTVTLFRLQYIVDQSRTEGRLCHAKSHSLQQLQCHNAFEVMHAKHIAKQCHYGTCHQCRLQKHFLTGTTFHQVCTKRTRNYHAHSKSQHSIPRPRGCATQIFDQDSKQRHCGEYKNMQEPVGYAHIDKARTRQPVVNLCTHHFNTRCGTRPMMCNQRTFRHKRLF